MSQWSGARIGWQDLPTHVRVAVEQIIGDGRVVEATSQTGGFSPGTADRVRTDAGRRAFVKAVSASVNERSAVLARQETLVSAALPGHAPVPRMLGAFDDGEWVALVLADVDGVNPRTPWVDREIDAAATALGDLAAALTPPPPIGVPTAADQLSGDFTGWDLVAADPPADLDPWEVARLDRLQAASAAGLATVHGGDTLVHCDIRADNLLVRPDGRMVVVDWPWACVGPDWLDRVLLAANVIAHGGDPGRLVAGVAPATLTAVVAGLAGMFRHYSRLPPPPGIPTVRAFQRWQADALRPWLRTRID